MRNTLQMSTRSPNRKRVSYSVRRLPIDFAVILPTIVSTSTETVSSDPDTEAILERVRGKPLDPAIYQRIREEGARITEEIRKKHGTLNIAVDLIRETRDRCD